MKKLLPIFLMVSVISFLLFVFNQKPALAEEEVKCDSENLSPERNPRPACGGFSLLPDWEWVQPIQNLNPFRACKCDLCNLNAPQAPSCANTFKTLQEVEYERGGPETIKWDGTIYIDPTEVKIPFVGEKNEEKAMWEFWKFWEQSHASENDYLADYFEGTNEYYRNYGNQTTLTDYQGVLRKLTPYEYQNQLKKQLIIRAQEKEIHDYKIKYIGRFCWDFPFWLDATKFLGEKIVNFVNDKTVNKIIAFFSHLLNYENPPEIKLDIPDIGHYCLYASLEEGLAGWFIAETSNFIENVPVLGDVYRNLTELSGKIPGVIHVYTGKTEGKNLSELANHLPPDPIQDNYQEKYLAWKESGPEDGKEAGYWYRLWQATPMLSREDTKGAIEPYLGPDAEAELGEIPEENLIEKVPHLARLYEGSKIISDLLTPIWDGEKTIEMVKTPEIPQTTPPFACLKETYLSGPEEKGDELCCQLIEVQLSGEFTNPYYPCDWSSTTIACQRTEEKDVSQDIGINLKHPYLDEIWSYTANAKGGFFNIFRPYGVPAFEDIDAADTISYSYSKGDVSPQQGLFFFPHLGGIEKAKEWVVNVALRPKCDKAISPQCPEEI